MGIKTIFKGGDYPTTSYYRPISLVNVMTKIFEKILKSRSINLFNTQNLAFDLTFFIINETDVWISCTRFKSFTTVGVGLTGMEEVL